MEYITLKGTGLNVSKFCLGTMTFGGQTSKEDSLKIIDCAIDKGINFFDTADIYTRGQSEEICGEAFLGRRDEFVIASKVGGPSGKGPNGKGLGRKHVLQSIDESLKRLKTDYLDIYYMHFPDPSTPIEEMIETMNLLINSGKIRYYGVSNFSAWQICSMIEKAHSMGLIAPVIDETVYNLITRPADSELLPFAKEYNLSLSAYNPLAGGLLTGKHTLDHAEEGSRFDLEGGYRKRYWKDGNFEAIQILNEIARDNDMSLLELSIRWIMTCKEITASIIGVSKLAQLQQNIEMVEKGQLPEEVFKKCDEAWNLIKGDYYDYHK